ncbi:MAG: ABC transporter permease subunit [Acholeplasmataceae bacterium]|nr:ABC transporter permease subunit [Acholeplasmataceae bacterium]
MNIYKFELKMLKSSILIWGLSIPLILFSYQAFYPTIAADTYAFDQLMANYPEELLAFFGMRPDLPMSSLLGYFSLTFGMMQIPLSIQAANYGFHMLSVEEREMTADFLLSKPVSRTKILISKFLAAFTSLTIINAGLWVASIGSLLLFKGDSELVLRNVVILLSTVVLFQLFFVGVGMLISVSVKKITSVIAYSMSLGFGLYIVFGLKSTFSNDLLALITPYAYFESAEILVTGKYNLLYTLINVGVIIVTFGLSYFLYKKRNIHSL